MVQLRAVPEGGPAGSRTDAALPYTFYDRYTAALDGAFARTFDRRQPLPAVFAVHFLNSAGFFSTDSRIRMWRETAFALPPTCNYSPQQAWPEFIRFDEHENAVVRGRSSASALRLPIAVRCRASAICRFPTRRRTEVSNDVGGWLYVNLDNGGSAAYSSTQPRGYDRQLVRHSQNWLMITDTYFSYFTLRNAGPLGNGCTPVPARSSHIGPLP